MTREEAISELNKPLYDEKELKRDIEFFCQKLDLTSDEFNHIMDAPRRSYTDYRNWDLYLNSVKVVQKSIARITGRRMKFYS